MRLFGLTIARTKSLVAASKKALSPVYENRGGWWPLIQESFAGAWQLNVTLDRNTILSNHAVYACMTLIASDFAKLRLKLVEKRGGVWQEVENPVNPVFTRRNSYQPRQQFFETWMLSKLSRGNTYVLMQRDGAGRVEALYVLDPNRVRVLIADDGSVFYELQQDELNRLDRPNVIVPARTASRPMIARISVVLPAPLRPMRPTKALGAIDSATSLSTGEPPISTFRPWMSSVALMRGSVPAGATRSRRRSGARRRRRIRGRVRRRR